MVREMPGNWHQAFAMARSAVLGAWTLDDGRLISGRCCSAVSLIEVARQASDGEKESCEVRRA